MHLLVTGGCGFIGSNFVHYVLGRYPEVRITNVDVMTYAANPKNLDHLPDPSRYRLVKADISNRPAIRSILQEDRPDYVVHFAAESHVTNSIAAPEPFVEANVVAVRAFLDELRTAEIKRILFVSTDEVYGSAEEGVVFTEQSPLIPSTPYAATKAGGELLAGCYRITYGLPIVVTRCSNNYGPRQHPEKLIPRFVLRALRNQPLTLHGDGLHLREWIHTEDHASAIMAILLAPQASPVINIGTGIERSTRDIAGMILRVLGRPASLLVSVPDRPGNDRRYRVDATRLRQEIGWVPSRNFEEALEDTIMWYVQNADWVEGFEGHSSALA